MTREEEADVAIIGAGPASSIAAALLRRRGWRVTVIERGHFPRFSIGESLLPQCMESLDAAGMIPALEAAGFQLKRGVAFAEGERYGTFDFSEQHSEGWSWTWQVTRADFDQILADEAARLGARYVFGQSVADVDFSTPGRPRIEVVDEGGTCWGLSARFICDASGFGRVLPKLLDLDRPADFPPRAALFTHVRDGMIPGVVPDRERILISIHPEQSDLWYWLIPFPDGRSSVGVVGSPGKVLSGSDDNEGRLRDLLAEDPRLAILAMEAPFLEPVRSARNYAASVSRLYGRDFALLGNAAEFVDPIFSSGVTVAMKSAVLASQLIDKQLNGKTADWETRFEAEMRAGLRVFAAFVNAWYAGMLRHVFFKQDPDPVIRRKICSILAGNVWDRTNPYVSKPEQRLKALCETCIP